MPGCVHTDLRAAGLIPDPFFGTNEAGLQWVGERDWEYRTHFTVPAALRAAEFCDLVADGLDTVATVTLNGHVVARTDNMFIGHRWPVGKRLRRGPNELRVRFASAEAYVRQQRADFTPPREFCDPVGNAVRMRKQPSQFGWDWAPRLVSAGIWRDLRVEAWDVNRLEGVHLSQRHGADGRVEVVVAPRLARPGKFIAISVVCSLRGRELARVESNGGSVVLPIAQPELWWPAGQGGQPLYDLTISAKGAVGADLVVLHRRIGLRTIVLDRHADQWGESFQFVVNGRPVFLKGANWIPAHSFVATLTREHYARDLTSAVEAHMNCVRLWGGGIYESPDFYALCDELGLLVWHDFMFACALYPSDAAFLRSVRAEAEYQVRRLQHHACLALWCGNNELVQLNAEFLKKDAALMRGYVKLFHELLPEVVARCDGATSYWPTSEWRGTFETGHALGEKSGDSHYWDVWHARRPVKDYEKWAFRFCSEFGMQSYSSAATNATFCPAADRNLFGPAMENHQKNALGNQVILDYVARRYRYPRAQEGLIYLSQLNQAYCMQVGVEHCRRLTPRCMGALYWQLNDCWPAASWSSIEFTGRWKALHYAARRFNAPALASIHVPGDETMAIGNTHTSTVNEAHFFTVCDAPAAVSGELRWELRRLDGARVLTGRKRVRLQPGQSVRHKTLNLRKEIATHARDQLYLRLALVVDGQTVSEQTAFLAAPRFLSLPKARIQTVVFMPSPTEATLTFASAVFQHAVEFDLAGQDYRADDNFFDLYPNEPRTIRVRLAKPATRAQLKKALGQRSLADTYD